MDNLKTFTSEEFGEITTIVIDGREYFEASKVANILGYSNPRDAVNRHCKLPGVVIHDMMVCIGKRVDGGNRTKVVKKKFIDEGNLYRLIIKSKLESAIKFEKWIMDEVLPSIRKNGTYMDENTIYKCIKDDKFLINLLKTLDNKNKEVINLKESLENAKPYIKAAKTITSCEDGINIGSFAKLVNALGINIGRNRLFAWFRNRGYIMKNDKGNEPKQAYIDQGYFKIRQTIVNTSDGPKINITTYITGKGQVYFIKKLEGDFCDGNVYRYF